MSVPTKQGECEACHHEGTVYECTGNPASEKYYLCDVCYRTPAGQMWKYYRCKEKTEIVTAVAAIANYMLDEIRQLKDK